MPDSIDIEKIFRSVITKTDNLVTILNALHKTGELATILLQVSQLPLVPLATITPEDNTPPSHVPRFRKKK